MSDDKCQQANVVNSSDYRYSDTRRSIFSLSTRRPSALGPLKDDDDGTMGQMMG